MGNIKDCKPIPWDIMKKVVARSLDGVEATYSQSFRAICSTASNRHEEDVQKFSVDCSLSKKFFNLNAGLHIACKTDNNKKHIERFFLCPTRIMKYCMVRYYVRPVMSLDAAHLRSEWKGTLYDVSLLTACHEIILVLCRQSCATSN